jgi:serine/threonine protein phosphatase PrpC
MCENANTLHGRITVLEDSTKQDETYILALEGQINRLRGDIFKQDVTADKAIRLCLDELINMLSAEEIRDLDATNVVEWVAELIRVYKERDHV